MPTYEYQCEKCGHEFEREQRITDEPLKTCPKCKAPKAKRLISATSFVLKGSGWYSDLYSSGGAKKEASKDKDKTGDSAPASSTASDSGSSTTPESKPPKKDSKKTAAA
ncbi:MAG TPA: zinc ribbon domain-containing protein [Myxococcota bacterium]|nr:zinc ribbon domain-containing protein [Myxococcota bacterium]